MIPGVASRVLVGLWVWVLPHCTYIHYQTHNIPVQHDINVGTENASVHFVHDYQALIHSTLLLMEQKANRSLLTYCVGVGIGIDEKMG